MELINRERKLRHLPEKAFPAIRVEKKFEKQDLFSHHARMEVLSLHTQRVLSESKELMHALS